MVGIQYFSLIVIIITVDVLRIISKGIKIILIRITVRIISSRVVCLMDKILIKKK